MNSYLYDYYNDAAEDSRLTTRHGRVEFITTMRYIDKYLFKGARILEIGAATGRYSHTLARRGYTVDAVELVPKNIDIFKQNTQASENVTIFEGDARDLSFLEDERYDLTLILGPLYHLYTPEEKRLVIQEALRVTKPNGVVFAAYCITDASVLDYGFKQKNIHSLLSPNDFCGLTMPGYKAWSSPQSLFEIVRKEDIDDLMRGLNVTRLHYVAVDILVNLMRDIINEMDDDTFTVYMDYQFFLCERPDMVGLTNHSLDIFRKNHSNKI